MCSSSRALCNPARPLSGLLVWSLSIRRSAAATRSRARSRSATVYCRGCGLVRFPRGPFEALFAKMDDLGCFMVAILARTTGCLNLTHWLSAHGCPHEPSRCSGIPGRTDSAAHAPLRGSTRDRITVAGHCRCRQRVCEVAGWGAIAFGLKSDPKFCV